MKHRAHHTPPPAPSFLSLALLLALAALHLPATTARAAAPATTILNAPVGHMNDGMLVTPVNQLVTPAGKLVELPGMRVQTLALSPDGKILVAAGNTRELTVINPATGKILQRAAFPADKNRKNNIDADENLTAKKHSTMSMNGLAFSPDGTRLYLASNAGEIKVFSVSPAGKVSPRSTLRLPPASTPKPMLELPAGIALSHDGKKLYAALALSNRLAEIDADTGKILRQWNTGVAPYDVVLARDKIYVSNYGGRRPDPDATPTSPNPIGPAGRGTTVRVDSRGVASEGSITIINLAQGHATPQSEILNPKSEIPTGRHTTALALSPDGRWLAAAATADDVIHVIDTRTDTIAEKISVRPDPGDPFGAQPTALAFAPNGKTLYATNATQNAIALLRFDPADKESAFLGLIPAGWFPAAIACDPARNQLCVANTKDLATQPEPAARGATGHGYSIRQFTSTLSLIPLPSTQKELDTHTRRALNNLRYPLLTQAALPPRPGRAPIPVPERAGEPSVFKHVIYIIKENRTYDQVLGDIKTGNGAPNLCTFGNSVTPNQHKLAREFVLLDNTYCSGAVSADGHHWTDSAIATDYIERQFTADWPRSYPAPAGDALANAPTGFLWDNALAHGKTVINYGEFTSYSSKRWKDRSRKDPVDFTAAYRDVTTGADAIECRSKPDLESLRPISDLNYIGWDLTLPDIWRARHIINALKKYEQTDTLPNLVIIRLPNDHTAGTKPGHPIPEAMVADNDLAMGRIIEALSHTKYWKDTCVFSIEDDSQNGWDHVSGYRTTAYVVSAYTKRGATISTQYNNTSILRTIELILGLPPMNQMDATATPMFDCFIAPGAAPDLTPFTSVPNRTRLNTLTPDLKTITDTQQRKDALASAKLPLQAPDLCDDDTLNRILWRALKGSAPYPEWAVKLAADND